MTGAPNIGVTAFSGMIKFVGMTQMRLHSKAIAAPISIVAGNNILWSASLVISLAICGTANPMNDTGPQKAVVMAVKIPVESKINFRVDCMLMPKFIA